MGRGGEEELLLPGAGGQKGDFEAGGQRRVGERKLAKFGGERVAGGRRKEEGGSPGWGVEVWVSGGGGLAYRARGRGAARRAAAAAGREAARSPWPAAFSTTDSSALRARPRRNAPSAAPANPGAARRRRGGGRKGGSSLPTPTPSSAPTPPPRPP